MVDMRSDFFNTEICIDDQDRKEWDKYERGSDERKRILQQGKYSALYGDFKGLCPLYFSASENEILINDSKFENKNIFCYDRSRGKKKLQI